MATQLEGVKLDTELLDKMIDEAADKAGEIVERYIFLIAGDAAKNAPVDTGALRNSIVSESGMVDKLNGVVQDGVEYGIFQELGTGQMAAQPFMIPAVERHAKDFLNSFAELFGFQELLK